MSRHPLWDELAGYAENKLDEAGRAAVARHLEDCVLCRLEIKGMHRFQAIADDGELIEESQWEEARAALNRSWREGILPALGQAEPAAPAEPPMSLEPVAPSEPLSLTRRLERRGLRLSWLLPAAAAAALIFFIVFRGGGPGTLQNPMLGDPLRGEAADSSAIVLVEPSGDLLEIPESFVWQSREACDSYALEIFTAELQSLYRVDRLAAGTFAAPDSLRGMLIGERVYLWSVEGFRGLDRVAVSPTAWFRVRPAPADSSALR